VLLNDKKIRNAPAQDKPYRMKDGDGLFLQVDPKGGKNWGQRNSFAGKEKMLAFGTYPEVSLHDAREKRLAARKLLANGIDPGAKKKEDKRLAEFKAESTFEAVAKEWFDTNKPKWAPDHAERLWRRLQLHMISAIGDRPFADITSLELLNVLRKVERRGTTETAHRLLQTAGVIFRYAVLTSRTKYNPTVDLKGALAPHRAENHPTILAKELPDFFKQLSAVDTSRQNKLAIWILMLSFVRQGELRQAKWEDIDFNAQEWHLPAHTMKMREAHVVPLARQAVKLLQELKTLTGEGELLFPSQQRRRHAMMSENTINHVLHKMGYKDKLVGHGFRALASTTLNEKGFRPDVIERQLAHIEHNKVRAAYNRAEYLPERKKMMQWWADYLEKAAASVTGKAGAA